MYCLTSRMLQLQMSVLQQSMSIFRSSRLVSQVNMMAGQNVRKKYLMCQIPIKILERHAIPNSSLNNLKIYLSKVCRKLVKDELYVWCSYLANTAVLNIYSNFQQKISLQIMGFYFEWWILLLLALISITQCVTK